MNDLTLERIEEIEAGFAQAQERGWMLNDSAVEAVLPALLAMAKRAADPGWDGFIATMDRFLTNYDGTFRPSPGAPNIDCGAKFINALRAARGLLP